MHKEFKLPFDSSPLLFRLKTIDVVIRNTQDAEDTLKKYEDCLREVNKVPNDLKEVETYCVQLKVWSGYTSLLHVGINLSYRNFGTVQCTFVLILECIHYICVNQTYKTI